MVIILSQKVDTDSDYIGDKLFKIYHYPGRYRNQIHTGDFFVYYQGNRHKKNLRYYFGAGIIGKITMKNEDNFYAELTEVVEFPEKIPIYLPDGGYVESLGYETIRKSINPPWQSSVRPLSKTAYEYIMQRSGCQELIERTRSEMKKAIQDYYVFNDEQAVIRIQKASQKLAMLQSVVE